MRLTPEQLEALHRFQCNRGRRWKAELRALWENGYGHGHQDSAALQQLRNELGPRWLIAYRPGDEQVGKLQAVECPPFPTPRQMFRGSRTMWRVAGADGVLLEPQHTKADCRRFCQNNGITLIEDTI